MSVGQQETSNGSKAAKCAIAGCVGAIEAKGYCRKHYRWLRMYGDPTHQPPRGGPKYSPLALERAGVTRAQRNRWALIGVLDAPADPATGRRIWTAGEVRVAVLVARLTAIGIHLPVAADIARAVVERGRTIHEVGNDILLTVEETLEDRNVLPW